MAQEARESTQTKATMVVMVATALHSIVAGNMLSTYHQAEDGTVSEINQFA